MRAALSASSTGTIMAVPRNPRRLPIADGQQRLVRDRLDEAGAERIGRDAEGADVVLERHVLDDVGMRGARCTSDPPSDSKNARSQWPVRCSAIWLAPPVTTF